RDDQGKPVILQCVREAQEQIRDSDYSGSVSSLGLKVVEESVKLAYGRNDLRFAGVPALSGTGGCRLFAESPIYLPDPTWSNHYNIWTNASVPTRIYRYYHPHSKGLDFAALMNDVKVKNHFPFFDMAYQGLVSGDMDRDAWSIRVFLDDGHLIGCSQSFSKTMGLFEHRVGCLSVLCSDTEKARQVQSQLHRITGAMYGSVPSHGLVLLSTVLSNPELKSLWTKEVKSMANHIQSTRSTLRESLELTGSNHNWEHITKQVGIFSLSGLTPDQIDRLADDFHIYTTPNGRIR
ncbi:Aspartate aminotransferase, mitochondrial, partial [Linum perenne]